MGISSKARPYSGDATVDDAGAVTLADESVQANDIELAQGSMLIGAATGAQALALTQGGIAVGGATDIAELAAEGNAKILVGNGTTLVSVTVSGDATLANTGALTIAADSVEESMVVDSAAASGLHVMKYALAVYDFAVDGGGSPGAIVLDDVCTIPANAVVELVSYDVLTTCADGADDSATIKVGLTAAGDLCSAVDIADGSNPWDQGPHLGSVVTAVPKKTTAADTIVVTSDDDDITAGKIVFCFRYYVTAANPA